MSRFSSIILVALGAALIAVAAGLLYIDFDRKARTDTLIELKLKQANWGLTADRIDGSIEEMHAFAGKQADLLNDETFIWTSLGVGAAGSALFAAGGILALYSIVGSCRSRPT